MRKVVVFGGANIDIIGRSDSKVIPYDSNIGKVIQTFGGVGRNIAENIARYGVDVHFVSVVGNDTNGKNLIQYCKEIGMNMDDCLMIDGESTSSYLAVLDDTGDMIMAINDMDILRFMSIDHVSKVLKRVNENDLIVIDTNLDQNILDYIFENATCDIYVDPISCKKAEKLKNHLSKIHTLKPNVFEAEVLSGIKYEGLDSVDKMGEVLLSQGVKEIFISLGDKGSKLFTNDAMIHCKSESVEVVNATGAGDAYMGAVVASSILGYDIQEKMKFASAASVCTIETGASVCKDLSVEFVNIRKEQLTYKIEEKKRCI